MIKLCAFSDEASSTLSGQIKALKRNNISYMELRSIDETSVINFETKKAKEYKKELDDNGIRVWSIGSSLGKVDINTTDFNEYKKVIRHTCELANIFDTKVIRSFSFYKAYNERNKVIDYVSEMVEIAKEYNVNMYHENEKDIYGDVADRVVDLLDNVKGLKCVYDPANFLQVGEKADKTIALVRPRADYFHVKDVIAKTQEIVPAGYGDGKLEDIVKSITDDKVMTLEPHLGAFIGYDKIDSHEMKTRFKFKNSDEAFDTAVNAIKEILLKVGYKEEKGAFIK